ncbi:putative serine carboxypeptidase CPVL isoform X3 [Lissotriton helveticus]
MAKMQKKINLVVMVSLAVALNLCSAEKWMNPFRKMFKGIKVSTPTRGDPGKPLFLTPYLESGRIQEARELSLVGPLPGYNVKSYSGYFTVNKTYNSNLFFWFFPAQVEPENAPLLLWLQGGPGGTSLFGLFVEHGPYVVNKNLTLSARKYPWTSHYSLIYIDNPVGTGFSFTDDDRGFAKDQVDVGRDLYSALIQFLQIFPEYQKNDFYATGESYAGKYVPAIGYYIHTHNPTAKIKINFKGMAIGDGLCDPEVMLGGYAEFFYQTGMADEKQRAFVQQQADLGVIYIQHQKWIEAFEVFDSLLNGDTTEYPSFYKNITGCDNYYNFLQCEVLMYSGQLDVIVAAPLTERFLPTVPWSKVEDYKNAERRYWKVRPSDTEVAGYVRQAGDFYQVIVRGGGHILPYDQAERSFDMIHRFISGCGWQLK